MTEPLLYMLAGYGVGTILESLCRLYRNSRRQAKRDLAEIGSTDRKLTEPERIGLKALKELNAYKEDRLLFSYLAVYFGQLLMVDEHTPLGKEIDSIIEGDKQ